MATNRPGATESGQTHNRVATQIPGTLREGIVGDRQTIGRVNEPRAMGTQQRVNYEQYRGMTIEELEELPYIGPRRAREIYNYLLEHPEGEFEDPSGGIGEDGDITEIPDGTELHKANTLKNDIIDGIKIALGIHDPAPYYKPNKINRDTGRLQNINRTPPSKTWSIAELQYYNRKGHVNYRVKNTEGKRLPTIFNPKLPTLELERRPPLTSYTKPGMHASIERVPQATQIPASFLVA